MSTGENRKFTKVFSKLTKMLLERLEAAETMSDVQDEFQMLEGLATTPNSPAAAKTIYGYAFLMDGKPWYDFEKGFEWVKKGADEAQDNEPYCWFSLGSLYLNGKPELPQDKVLAKHWIDRAAAVGYKDAVIVKEVEWGNNPDGFKEWLNENYERVDRQRRRLMIAVPTVMLLVIVAVVILIFRR